MVMLLCGWATARGIDLYRRDGGDLDQLAAPVVGAVAALAVRPAAAAPVCWRERNRTMPTTGSRPRLPIASAAVPAATRASPPAAIPAMARTGGTRPDRPPVVQDIASPLLSPAVLPPSIVQGGSRLAGSAWFIGRNGSAPGVAGSQLGASQAGVRTTYALGDNRRLALAARVSAPVSGRGKEAAVGIDWQPTRAPVHVIAERRFALDGGPGGTMVGIVGGFGPKAVAPGVHLEGYGQAGVIARDGGSGTTGEIEGFGDGAVRASHPLRSIGAIRIDIGAGIWGGAQRGAARLDIGPSAGIVVPVGRGLVRVTADWRQRIAGDARPDSGPALSLGTNF
jgi:hypothetical protein